ncbi:hypothetical protein AC578_6801 [Pseudocercospora eumusae]|uniref:Uncharacterized protein n=1 Tax=Pseudocercospora eumusae TaxID=321146 RepID=A0A139GVT7_9PEZI|nr:hypothetical protein AC578_6801 [Pseudocercospora eumusae]
MGEGRQLLTAGFSMGEGRQLLTAGFSMGRLAEVLNPIDPRTVDQIEENTAELRRAMDQMEQHTQIDNINRMLEGIRAENEHRVERYI